MIEQTLENKGRKPMRGEALTATSIYTADVAFLLDEVKRLERMLEGANYAIDDLMSYKPIDEGISPF